MWLTVNGESRQKSSTANMIFDVPTLVSYLSQFMSLLPGDVISTGTPAGVGLGIKPSRSTSRRRRGGAGHRGAGPLAAAGRAVEMRRYVLTLDLKTTRVRSPSTRLITARCGPEVQRSLRRVGVGPWTSTRSGAASPW